MSLNENEKKVIACLKDGPAFNVKAAYIALVTNITKSELNRTLNYLIDKGLVERIGRHTHTKYALKKKEPKEKIISFKKECKVFTQMALEDAIEKLEGIGPAADDAGLPEVSGRIFSVIDELREILAEAK